MSHYWKGLVHELVMMLDEANEEIVRLTRAVHGEPAPTEREPDEEASCNRCGHRYMDHGFGDGLLGGHCEVRGREIWCMCARFVRWGEPVGEPEQEPPAQSRTYYARENETPAPVEQAEEWKRLRDDTFEVDWRSDREGLCVIPRSLERAIESRARERAKSTPPPAAEGEWSRAPHLDTGDWHVWNSSGDQRLDVYHVVPLSLERAIAAEAKREAERPLREAIERELSAFERRASPGTSAVILSTAIRMTLRRVETQHG